MGDKAKEWDGWWACHAQNVISKGNRHILGSGGIEGNKSL
jgi:hypothetical protein